MCVFKYVLCVCVHTVHMCVCVQACEHVLVTQFPTISLPSFFPLLSVCVLQSLFPLVPLCKHAVLSLVISFSSKRQGQRVLYKYFKLNSSMLSECFFSTPLSNIASLMPFPSSTLKHLQPNGWILWCFYLFQAVCTHTGQGTAYLRACKLLFSPYLFA